VSFSYVDPMTVPRDAVRLLIGDTVEASALFSDEDLGYFLAEANSKPKQAALLALDALAARFSNQVDITLGKLRLENSQRAEAYAERAAKLRQRIGLSGVRIVAGGRTWSERYAARSNTDALQPAFEIGGSSDYMSDALVWDRWA